MNKIYIFLFLLFITACSPASHKEVWIENAQNERIYVNIDGLENASYHKLAFIQHGLASNMSHPAVQKAKQAFLDNHFVVITFDSRYSLGKSDNRVQNVRCSTFKNDLETVIHWAKKQSFYHQPYALSGHSLGGATAIAYSAEHPKEVNLLVPITPVTGGMSWEKTCMQNMTDFCIYWKQRGNYEYTDHQKHQTVTIPYEVIKSCMNYNAYLLAPKIEAKTLLIGAQNDIVVNASDIENVSEKFEKGSVKIIKSSGHNFETKQNQTDLYNAINVFLR